MNVEAVNVETVNVEAVNVETVNVDGGTQRSVTGRSDRLDRSARTEIEGTAAAVDEEWSCSER